VNGGKVQQAVLNVFAKSQFPVTVKALSHLLAATYQEDVPIIPATRSGYETVRRAVSQLVDRGLLKRREVELEDGRRFVVIGTPEHEDWEFIPLATFRSSYDEPFVPLSRDQEIRCEVLTTIREELGPGSWAGYVLEEDGLWHGYESENRRL